MNPLLREAAASVELGWVMGAMMDEIGRMPFMDGGDS
jgi:hypothetical protein